MILLRKINYQYRFKSNYQLITVWINNLTFLYPVEGIRLIWPLVNKWEWVESKDSQNGGHFASFCSNLYWIPYFWEIFKIHSKSYKEMLNFFKNFPFVIWVNFFLECWHHRIVVVVKGLSFVCIKKIELSCTLSSWPKVGKCRLWR